MEYDEVGRTEDEDRQSVYDINNKTCSDFLPNNECDDSPNSQEESPLVEGPIEIHPTSTDRLALYGNNQTYLVENGEHPKQTISEESNAVFDESSVSEDEMDIVEPQNHSTSYHIEENCSNKGKPKLFDSLGYEYTLHRSTSAHITWRCAIRNKKIKCRVLIKQKKSKFIRPPNQNHCHQPKIGAKAAATVIKNSKLKAAKAPFVPASKIVRETIQEQIPPSQCEAMEKHDTKPMENMIRNVNNYRKNLRPTDSSSKDFELLMESIPQDFLLEDIINGERHIIFATKKQLNLLTLAKTWFVDGTFKFVKHPFVQLFSIHAFVKSNGDMIQVPLAFCIISRRQSSDYSLIFEAIAASFESPPRVQRIVLDFVSAVWKAIRQVFPSVELRGCSFHFTQSIYRQVQNVGLQTTYINNFTVRK